MLEELLWTTEVSHSTSCVFAKKVSSASRIDNSYKVKMILIKKLNLNFKSNTNFEGEQLFI